MNVADILASETGITIVGAIFGSLWTFFKSRDWYARARGKRYYKAIHALEAAVEQTYRTYVVAIKEARADGRLSRDEKRHARDLARAAAIEFGRTQGTDVLTELGDDFLDLWIAKIVKRFKRR